MITILAAIGTFVVGLLFLLGLLAVGINPWLALGLGCVVAGTLLIAADWRIV